MRCPGTRRTHPRRTHSQRRGASLIEFAIVIPVFILFVFGIVEIGRGLMVTHLLNNAARDGCRQGILGGKSTSEINAVVDTVLGKQGISGHSTTVKINDAVAEASTAQSGDEITVLVRVPASSITWLPGAKYLTGNLAGQFTLRRE
jgi:Flp pilus assembly protein TadG